MYYYVYLLIVPLEDSLLLVYIQGIPGLKPYRLAASAHLSRISEYIQFMHPCAFATRFRWITFCTYKHLILSPSYKYRWGWHSLVQITYYTYRNNSLLLILHNTTTNAHIFTILSFQITKCCLCRVRSMREGFHTQLCCWQFISDNTSFITSRWRHNGRDGVWLLNRLYRSR